MTRPGEDAWKSGVAGSTTMLKYNDYGEFALPTMGGAGNGHVTGPVADAGTVTGMPPTDSRRGEPMSNRGSRAGWIDRDSGLDAGCLDGGSRRGRLAGAGLATGAGLAIVLVRIFTGRGQDSRRFRSDSNRAGAVE